MKKAKNTNVLLTDITAGKVLQKLQTMPNRYRNYTPREGKGNWRVDHMSKDKETLSFMLIDSKFDAPRANAKPECPVFHVTLEQQGEDVRLNYRHKWQPRVVILAAVYGLLTLAVLLAGIYFLVATNWISGIACMCTFLAAAVMILVYLIRLTKHNALTRKVFEEIIAKNFSVEEAKEVSC